MRRGFVAGAILATWIGSLAWLAARERGSGGQVGGLEDRMPPSDAYLAMRVGEVQVGIVSGTLDTLASGARTVERVDLVASGPDGSRRQTLASDLRFGPGLSLEEMSVIRSGDGPRVRAMATRDTGRFTARMTVGGDTASWHWPPPSRGAIRTVASALRYLGLTRNPAGETVLLLDPASLDWDFFQGRVVADTVLVVPDSAAIDSATGRWIEARWDTVPARRVEYTIHGLPFDGWVDRDGNLVRSATPLGAELVRSAFEIVRQEYHPADLAGRAGPGAPRLGAVAARSPERVAGLVVVLDGADTTLPAWHRLDLDTPWQTRRGDTLATTAPASARRGPLETASRVEWALVRPSGSVPASHPLVEAQARRAAGEGTDPAQLARAVSRWMRANLRLDSAGPGHPVAALERRRASAAGMTALYVALLRALGVPARPVAGLRWDGDAFHYHGWAEVRLPDGWLPVDPALDQFPADGSRLRLATGVGADPLVLMPLVGRLRPRLLHVELAR